MQIMLKPFLLIYCMFLLSPTTQTIDYCKICNNNSHTMCKYKKGPAETCVNYTSAEMSVKMRDRIVKLHNRQRNVIASGIETRGNPGPQPSAANMLRLKWDDELATIAQRWGDQCISIATANQHDECRKTDRFEVGQNIIITLGNIEPAAFEELISQMILQWYIEVANVNSSMVGSFQRSPNDDNDFQNDTSHYAQMVWATTKYVGCAHVSFVDYVQEKQQHVDIDKLICNYGPAGNMPNKPIYKTGAACSECGSTCSKEFPALCENPERNSELSATSITTVMDTTTPEEGTASNVTAEEPETTTTIRDTSNKNNCHGSKKESPLKTYYQDGDECYCLYRIKSCAPQPLRKTCMLIFTLFFIFTVHCCIYLYV